MRSVVDLQIISALLVVAALGLYGCGGGGGNANKNPEMSGTGGQTDQDRAAEEAKRKAEEARKKAEEEVRKRAEEEASKSAEQKAKTAADAAASAALAASNAASAAATAAKEADKYRMEEMLDASKAAAAAATAEAKSTEAAEARTAAQTALATARSVEQMSEKVRMYQQAAMDSAEAAAQSATQAAKSATLARSHADHAVLAAAPYEAVEVGLNVTAGNPKSATLLSYLRAMIGTSYIWRDGTSPKVPGLGRFETPATVRLARGSSSHHRALFHHTVALINRELPHQWHLRIGPDAPALTSVENVPQNQIIVDFAPYSDWKSRSPVPPDAAGFADNNPHQEFDRRQNRWEVKRFISAKVYVRSDRNFWTYTDGSMLPAVLLDAYMLTTLLHELLHAMGLANHVDDVQFPDSLMRASSRVMKISETDGAALRAIYLRYSNGTEPEQLNAGSLGHWDSQVTDLSGTIGPVSFGVRHRNGVGVPWTRGAAPGTVLAENRSITGTAKWRGGLLGFTTGQRSVGGNTVISVDLGTLTGMADFTKLQSWPSGQKPGALGTGTQWGDGDLGYTIAVSNNLLRSTGGDSGVVAGHFYSHDHSGVAGSLERSDLSAAFGAKLQ